MQFNRLILAVALTALISPVAMAKGVRGMRAHKKTHISAQSKKIKEEPTLRKETRKRAKKSKDQEQDQEA